MDMSFTTIKVEKAIINEYKILAVQLDKPRKNLIEIALKEFLEKHK
jgi:predicted transcriptional regulator